MKWTAIALFVLGCAAHAPLPPPPPKPTPPPEPSEPTGLPAGYVEMTADRVLPEGDGAALLLADAQGDVVPIFIGGTEAVSIYSRMRGQTPIRPLTHDLLDHVLDAMHAKLVQVQVDEVRDTPDGGGVYIGSIYVRTKGRVFKLDARPSDAIALAVGDHVPIYVALTVVEAAKPYWNDLQRQLPTSGESG